MSRGASWRWVAALPLIAAGRFVSPAGAQQVADSAFSVPFIAPAYPGGAGPVVLLDEAHANFHTLDGRYFVFGKVLRQDGYQVRPSRVPLSAAALAGARVLVIANALHPSNTGKWELPTLSAFAAAEITAVRAWVEAGGSLLLIADHMPFPGAASALAAAFGVHMRNGFAFDSSRTISRFSFTRASGRLAAHPVTDGRDATERVDSVVAFTGQAFHVDAPARALMTLDRGTIVLEPHVAWQFDEKTPTVPGAGLLQGAVLTYGKGRVAIFGEAAMFSAQLGGARRLPMGMNDPAAPQNPQFLLNVMHWLSGLLPAGR
ncbi:MAG: DUF4350 domain-containing protein [Gemmatimonadetes bacterium]|nr:DUF4350 domain-containing protein [Gemmatimonadota bacterium]